MDLGKLLVERLHDFMEEENVVEVRVGRISKELEAEFEANRAAHEAEHEAIKAQIDAYIEKITKNHTCDKFNDEKAELWEKVYDELGLPEHERGLHYSIKNGSRIVFRKDEKTVLDGSIQ